MAFSLEDKLVNLAKAFCLVDKKASSLKEGLKMLFKRKRETRPRKLEAKAIQLLRNYYIELERPQISLLMYFLYLDYPWFPKISCEWMRKVLIREKVYSVGPRKKVFRQRFEASSPGVLIQGDTSWEKWIEGDDQYYHLIVFLDDCSRLCLGGKLVPRDTIPEHFNILKDIVKKYGKFLALYYDNDEKYSCIRHGNSRYFEYTKREADLQVVRALSEIGIRVINSRPFDPCGKGKIERFIGTVQLQLPVWFRRYGVRTLEEANEVLKMYLRYYNKEQRHREIDTTPHKKFLSLKEESKFTKIAREVNLNKVFSYRYERKVAKDNTVRFKGGVYQLERKPFVYSYSGKKVEIRYMPGKPLAIYIDGEKVTCKKVRDKLPKLTSNSKKVSCPKETCEKVAIL
jgi:transposase InsO family protein